MGEWGGEAEVNSYWLSFGPAPGYVHPLVAGIVSLITLVAFSTNALVIYVYARLALIDRWASGEGRWGWWFPARSAKWGPSSWKGAALEELDDVVGVGLEALD